ncbi:uncharacterized protein DS421_6g196830 [Arachis hypogaea]|nr:uncharacterized protein DS421_6g196830 [Arachis hypogaea]
MGLSSFKLLTLPCFLRCGTNFNTPHTCNTNSRRLGNVRHGDSRRGPSPRRKKDALAGQTMEKTSDNNNAQGPSAERGRRRGHQQPSVAVDGRHTRRRRRQETEKTGET